MNTRPDLWPGYLSAMWSLMSLALLLIGVAPALADGRAQESSAEWNPDEQQVLRNTAADQPTSFDKKKLGNLRSTFLQKLLTGRLKESRNARYIVIRYARVAGDLDISYSEVKPYVSLKKCTLEGSVDFSWCSFAKGLNLSSGDFKKDVTFWGLEAKGPFRRVDAKFSGEETVNVRSLRVDHVVDFRGAVFHPEADFAFSRVGDIYCGDATFYQKARFDHMRIEGDASFDTTTFDGPVKFEHSTVMWALVSSWMEPVLTGSRCRRMKNADV